ncbi:tyrosine-type recombinase/integrase [Psychrobacter celer]|uniref:tyrosine-type recombinase/integrase n=1 Tax=Psychrobacter celer TaxID=306572 RepID=UPI003FCF3BF5
MAALKTDTQIKRAIKDAKGQKRVYHTIGGYQGLRLRLRGGCVEFQHRYTHPITGKRKEMTLGQYPALTLEQARQTHADNIRMLTKMIDPITQRDNERARQATAITNTFQAVADDWLYELTSNPDHQPATSTLRNINNYLKPLVTAFGQLPVSEITSQQVLALCRDIQKEYVHKGNRVKHMAQRIFAHAVLKGFIEYNPVTQLSGAKALKATRTKHHASLTDPKDFAVLLKDIDLLSNTSQPYNKPILQLLALTFARVGDICAMKWADIDLNAKQWVFTPQKGQRRDDMVESLVIPLAPQAIAVLERLRPLTGGHDYVFHNPNRKKAPHHDPQAVNKVLNDPSMNKSGIGAGYEGRGYLNVHTPHGFRASAKTMLMERLGYDELLTEIQLGHQMLNKYGKAYNRMQAVPERTRMMNEWANYLDDIKAGKFDNVIHASFKQQSQKLG